MKILMLTHGLWFGGAQISILEFLDLLQPRLHDLKIIICKGASKEFISRLKLDESIYEVSCRNVMGYPAMSIDEVEKLIREADLVWLMDIEFLAAPMIKRIRRDIPVVAHLHSYALICPWWGALYRFREICVQRCSIWRIARCKQGINLELARVGALGKARAGLYYFLDYGKGPLDYVRWKRLMEGVVDAIDGFIAVSHMLWNIHVLHMPELKDKPHTVVYNPVTLPLRYVRPRLEEPYGNYVLYASGSNPAKGPHILLEAWRGIEKEFGDLKLVMVGCKNSWVENKVRQLGLKNVELIDKLPPEKFYELMYKARVVVMPSIWPEPFGRVAAEANMLGVPAVISDRCGFAEIVHENLNGKIWSCCSSQSLTRVIGTAIQSKWSRERIIDYINHKLDPDRIRDDMIRFFEDVRNA